MKLRIKKLHPDAIIPTRSNSTDSGLDLYSIEDGIIQLNEQILVHCGIAIELPEPMDIDRNYLNTNETDYWTGIGDDRRLIFEGQIRPRSGLAKKYGITIVNSPGTIDCFSENMKIKTVDGDKSIKKLSINDIVFSVNNNMEVEKDTIEFIIDKGELEVYKIETEEGILEITKNTPIYTSDGIKYVNELKKDDKIIIF